MSAVYTGYIFSCPRISDKGKCHFAFYQDAWNRRTENGDKFLFRWTSSNLVYEGHLLGPVHTYPEIPVSANFFMRIHLASTRVRRIRSVYPEISVYALQSGNFCIRCVSGYVWTLVSVYFCIRWRHSIRTSLNAHALLTNPLRCPDTNRIRVDGRIRFVYATCGRRYFCIRIKKFADTKISGYVWTGPKKCTKKRYARAKLLFCEYKPIAFFYCSPCRRRRRCISSLTAERCVPSKSLRKLTR